MWRSQRHEEILRQSRSARPQCHSGAGREIAMATHREGDDVRSANLRGQRLRDRSRVVAIQLHRLPTG